MPRMYERLRDKFKREGLSTAAAQRKAAKIYNSRNPKKPVTGKHKGK